MTQCTKRNINLDNSQPYIIYENRCIRKTRVIRNTILRFPRNADLGHLKRRGTWERVEGIEQKILEKESRSLK